MSCSVWQLPYEIPECHLLLFELLPYEERVQLAVSEAKCIINVRRRSLPNIRLQFRIFCFSCYLSSNIEVSFPPCFHLFKPQLVTQLKIISACRMIYLKFAYISSISSKTYAKYSDNQLSQSSREEPCNFSSECRILEALQLPQSCGQFPWVGISR